jgi:DNA-binding NtrC family response regulator
MDLLLVEDKDRFRRLRTQALEGSAWTVRAVADPQEALAELAERPSQVLVTDLRLPGMSGLELIRRARRLHPALRVVLMSAFGEPKDIVEAMKLGADDFLPKPFDLDAFLALLERLRALAGAPPPNPSEPWISHSPVMQALEAALRRAADSDLPVLFRGERGAGKARSARRLHLLRDPAAPYLSVPAATLGPEGPSPDALGLLQGGSLFLAGLEHLQAEAVPALIQAMDSDAGARIHWIASAPEGHPLPGALNARLGALELRVPPLRERREEILPLMRLFLEWAASREGRSAPWLERGVERALLDHTWPGNVRELEILAGRLLQFTEGMAIRRLPDLRLGEASPMCLSWPEPGPLEAMLKVVGREAEGQLLARTLAEASGDLPRAADRLGLTPRALAQRLRDHGIPLEDEAWPSPRKAP